MPPKTTTASADSLRKNGIEATLSLSEIFSGLKASELSVIADVCRARSLKKQEVLFREGDKAEGLYVIQSGQMCIYRIVPNGRRQIIHVFGAGDSFAEVVIAAKDTYPANAVALKPSQVILVPRAPLQELITRNPQLALNIVASISLHMKALLQSLHTIKGHHAEGRLAAWLLENAGDAGGADAGGQIVTLPLTKKVLAGQLGVQGETLSRMLAHFKKERVLDVSKRQIRILNRARLEACADGRAK